MDIQEQKSSKSHAPLMWSVRFRVASCSQIISSQFPYLILQITERTRQNSLLTYFMQLENDKVIVYYTMIEPLDCRNETAFTSYSVFQNISDWNKAKATSYWNGKAPWLTMHGIRLLIVQLFFCSCIPPHSHPSFPPWWIAGSMFLYFRWMRSRRCLNAE